MIYLWSLGAAVQAVAVEALFVRLTYSTLFPWIIIPAMGINYCIYNIVRGSDNLVEALAVFSLVNVFLRIGMSYGLGQPVSEATWIVAGLLVAANLVKAVL